MMILFNLLSTAEQFVHKQEEEEEKNGSMMLCRADLFFLGVGAQPQSVTAEHYRVLQRIYREVSVTYRVTQHVAFLRLSGVPSHL